MPQRALIVKSIQREKSAIGENEGIREKENQERAGLSKPK